MAKRVDWEGVKQIFETELTKSQLETFITAASLIVDTIDVTQASPSMTSAELVEVERWLAAHLAAINDMREREVQIGEARISYEGWGWEAGLKFTRYGMQVCLLDRTGTIANLGQKSATFRVSPRRGGRKDSVLDG